MLVTLLLITLYMYYHLIYMFRFQQLTGFPHQLGIWEIVGKGWTFVKFVQSGWESTKMSQSGK